MSRVLKSHKPFFSVIANADRISPFNKGTSHFFCCSGEPYLAKTSAQTIQIRYRRNTMRRTHISCVGSGAIHNLRGHMAATSENFCHYCILYRSYITDGSLYQPMRTHLQVGERDTVLRIMRFAKEKIPKTEFLGFDLEFLNNGNNCLPSFLGVGWQLSMSEF